MSWQRSGLWDSYIRFFTNRQQLVAQWRNETNKQETRYVVFAGKCWSPRSFAEKHRGRGKTPSLSKLGCHLSQGADAYSTRLHLIRPFCEVTTPPEECGECDATSTVLRCLSTHYWTTFLLRDVRKANAGCKCAFHDHEIFGFVYGRNKCIGKSNTARWNPDAIVEE